MTQFKDNAGRQWNLSITVGSIKAVRNAIDIDLADSTRKTADLLEEDPITLVNVLWLLCGVQAAKVGITEEQFGEGLVGDAIAEASDALVGAIADFFPGRRRLLLQRANSKMRSVRETAENLALAKLDDPTLEAKINKAMEDRIEAEIQTVLTRLSLPMNSPDRPEASTPTRRRSANSGGWPEERGTSTVESSGP